MNQTATYLNRSQKSHSTHLRECQGLLVEVISFKRTQRIRSKLKYCHQSNFESTRYLNQLASVIFNAVAKHCGSDLIHDINLKCCLHRKQYLPILRALSSTIRLVWKYLERCPCQSCILRIYGDLDKWSFCSFPYDSLNLAEKAWLQWTFPFCESEIIHFFNATFSHLLIYNPCYYSEMRRERHLFRDNLIVSIGFTFAFVSSMIMLFSRDMCNHCISKIRSALLWWVKIQLDLQERCGTRIHLTLKIHWAF